jgi:hypothetical protein
LAIAGVDNGQVS